ncbi:hypothetical protein OJAV_G00067010 [Oryzias javanicus]|uniref:IF rod domain-containing protein n=1 Tax=Oryzias javanicus TaxID=123683 RepID=A0A3S2PD96_ORYJA|nr:hypothetical protein OJAV_G00067010 [Oryzias javanicus]
MSVRTKHKNGPGTPIYSQGFSAKSLGSYTIPRTSSFVRMGAPIRVVTTDQSLLVPLNLEIDPNVKVACNQEKDQIKTLNNRFVSFINKVRTLEQENKMLQTKWKLLNEQTDSNSNIESMLKSYITHLERQLDDLKTSNEHCEEKRGALHHQVDIYREKYETELNKRTDGENDFVLMKKEVDIAHMSTSNLHHKLSSLTNEREFLKGLYNEERRELQQRVANTNVVVEMDNSRKLNMGDTVSEVKAHYEAIAAQGREEVERWYETKLHQMTTEARRKDTELHDNKKKVAELQQKIRRLEIEIHTASSEKSAIESRLAEAEQNGDKAIMGAKSSIKDLEQALHSEKLRMAKQIRDYQDLMNVKMGLDMEISTYRKLLEQEEKRLENPSFVNIKEGVTKTENFTVQTPLKSLRSGTLLIKIEETHDVKYS